MAKQSTKALTITLPPAVVAELDRVRHVENRTSSEVVCDALRQYMAGSDGKCRVPLANPEPEETAAAQSGARGDKAW